MIDQFRQARWVRGVTWLLMLVMVLPWLAGCATPPPDARQPGPPPEARQPWLAGVVVDGGYLARDDAGAFFSVWRNGRSIPVQKGMQLQQGDRFATGDSAEAVIRFPSGSELFVRARSSARIGSITEAVGEFFVKVYGLFSIETEYVKAGARGTAFAVRAAPDGQTEVLVLDGAVEVASRRNAWRSLNLAAGSATLAHPQAPLARRLTQVEIAETRDWVERLEQQVPQEPASSGSSSGAGAAVAALAIGALAAVLMSSGGDKPSDGVVGRPDPTRPDRRPNASQTPPLTEPVGLRPGSTNARRPARLACRSPATLSWRPVSGARDYVVTLESLPPRTRNWQTIAAQKTGPTSARTPKNLNTRLRWRVQARDERGAGPASAVMYFTCTSRIVR